MNKQIIREALEDWNSGHLDNKLFYAILIKELDAHAPQSARDVEYKIILAINKLGYREFLPLYLLKEKPLLDVIQAYADSKVQEALDKKELAIQELEHGLRLDMMCAQSILNDCDTTSAFIRDNMREIVKRNTKALEKKGA